MAPAQSQMIQAQPFLERAFVSGGDPMVLVWLIRLAKGLQDRDMAWDYWRKLQNVYPNHVPGALEMLDFISPKWYGSPGEVLDFARSITRTAPAGSLLHALTPAAHIEVWVEETATSKNEYFLQPEVIEEVRQAWEISSNYPRLEMVRLGQQLHHHFALAFTLSKKLDLAKVEFSKILDTPPPIKPWGYVGLQKYYDLKRNFSRLRTST